MRGRATGCKLRAARHNHAGASCSTCATVLWLRPVQGSDTMLTNLQVAFAYKDKAHSRDVTAEPQVKTVQRLLQQVKRSDAFSLNVETESTSDAARLVAFILTHNSKCARTLETTACAYGHAAERACPGPRSSGCTRVGEAASLRSLTCVAKGGCFKRTVAARGCRLLPEAHAKALVKRWGYSAADARVLTPSFLLPMRVRCALRHARYAPCRLWQATCCVFWPRCVVHRACMCGAQPPICPGPRDVSPHSPRVVSRR